MAEKKFKPTKKQGIYAAAGAALVGTMAAAAITAPNLINNAFNADKYSFNETRNNGNVAYNTAESAGGRSGNSDSDITGSEGMADENEMQDENGENDSREQNEDVKRPPEEQNKAPQDAKRDPSYNNKGSSQEASNYVGKDENGYALVNSNLTTDIAASKDSSSSKLIENSDNIVDMRDKEPAQTIPTAAPSVMPTPRTTARPSEVPSPTSAPATQQPRRTASPTAPASTPAVTAVPNRVSATEDPMFGAITGPVGGSSTNRVSPAPDSSPVPGTSSEPAASNTPATPPPATTEPTPQATSAPTRAPLPTPEPDKSQRDAIEEGKNSGTEMTVSKGEVDITNRRSGSGSSVSSGGATRIDFTKFTDDQSDVEYIQVASSVRNINFDTAKTLFPNLKGYVVSSSNKYYQSIDGVLYSKDGKTLYACPAQLESIENFPEELETIYDGAFMGSQMKDLTLPETVTKVGKNAFAEASMGTVTFNSQELTLGETAFYNKEDDGLSVKKLVFKGTKPPEVTDNNALMFKNPNTGLDRSGMVIEVPDAEDDTPLREYIKAWGETIDGIYGSGMTSYLFNTEADAGKNYAFENNALYKKLSSASANNEGDDTAQPSDTDSEAAAEDNSGTENADTEIGGYDLLYVAPSTEGSFTPLNDTRIISGGAFNGCSKITSLNIAATVEKLESGCFKGLTGLTSIVVSGSVPAQIGEDVWSDIDTDEVSIYVYPEARSSYLESWGKSIDDALGAGTAEKLIKASAETYTYIDGALYAVHEGGNVLMDAPHTDLDNFKIDDSAVEIAEGAFGSKYTYNYVVIPKSVKTIDKDAFNSTKIEVLVMTAEEPPELPEGTSLDGIKALYVPSGSADKYMESWGSGIDDIQSDYKNYTSESHAVYGINDDDTYTLLNLPIVYNGSFTMLDTVREIRERAMAGCTDVTEIGFSVITDKIGKEAFINNTSLKSVNMSRMTSMREMPEKAFYNNSSMTDMQLPELIEVIGESMAAENTSLESVNFNKLSKLRSIGAYAFYNDKALKQVTLSSSSSLTEIGESAFENDTELTTARLPVSLTKLSDRLFKNASSLSRVSFASTLKSIGNETFYGTAIDNMNFTYFDSLESIGEGAFAANDSLKVLMLPDKLKNVSARLAQDDTELSTVSLSPSTEEIGDAAFKGCVSLEEIDIPAAIKKIGEEVFDGCDKLSKVIVRAEEPAEIGNDAFGSKFAALRIYVPDEAYEKYLSAWDEGLYNKAAQIIQKLSSLESGEPERTPVPTEVPVSTLKPTLPTLPPITPSGSSVPSPTQAPDSTLNPDATAVPGSTVTPDATSAPDATTVPDASTAPENTSSPDATEAPAQSEEPAQSDEPKQTEAPSESDAEETPETAKEPAESVQEEKTPSPVTEPEEDNGKNTNSTEESAPAPAIEPKQQDDAEE